jgi:hypothetical protein
MGRTRWLIPFAKRGELIIGAESTYYCFEEFKCTASMELR